ncbi:regulator of protease activity HflC (stomatin/prohibitin superfamily) [Enterococcus sp. PF1-24]|uniref:SPFH domain-containing protein n=1 Tax=unclassified Enterococcus TaxID=2608891 RepID=UPI0024762A96|nr:MULTISPECIES: SPFH domain-containing protein [unclassified Enterococcus]MDH6365086.1 regulator of protease activity HflC (stomatin/prohibitin superfamily) [Enterococcus sp. PFB1-1]MDH6402141.1 regulator of protease activity HflC (stomatin/prohibitin superfamily) [Enterococcus sp. PF1-24]
MSIKRAEKFKEKSEGPVTPRAIKLIIQLAVVAVVVVLASFKFFEKIDNGYVGVRYSINGGIKDEVLAQGVKFVGIDNVIQYPIRLQTIQAEGVSVSTSDGKKTSINIKYDYKVDSTRASKMYKEFGNITPDDIEEGWLKSKLQKEAREVYSKYSLLDVLSGKSSAVEAELLENFAKAVEGKGFIVEDVTVGVPEVDEETQKSIDAIIRAGQENEKAKLDSETTKTQADANAYEVTKAAEAEAEANRKIAESITDELIRYEEAQARKEHGWVTVNGAGTVVTDTTGE